MGSRIDGLFVGKGVTGLELGFIGERDGDKVGAKVGFNVGERVGDRVA